MNINYRMRKINELLHRALANIISTEIDNNRLLGVTITGVKVSKDLSIAKVYVSFFEETKINNNLLMLNEYAKKFRSSLAVKVKLRRVPILKFYYDESLVIGNKMNELFTSINSKKDN